MAIIFINPSLVHDKPPRHIPSTVELNRQTAVGVFWKSVSCMIINLIIILS